MHQCSDFIYHADRLWCCITWCQRQQSKLDLLFSGATRKILDSTG